MPADWRTNGLASITLAKVPSAMSLVVAIVGRPNVGKSSLFNCLARRRIAIVDPTSGVTRDRISTPIEHRGAHFELVDTGGIGVSDVDHLDDEIEAQIAAAMGEASLIVFVVDVRDGLTPLDRLVAERLRPLGKPIVMAANKVDHPRIEPQAADFFELGFGAPVCTSASHAVGRTELLDQVVDKLGEQAKGDVPEEPAMKLALVGKRNAGKSTLVNALAHADRVIVSEVPGTTRDSIDVRFERDGAAFVAIDTAGLRKKKSISSAIEFYSLHRAQRSIRRADVVLFLLDAPREISQVDKQVGAYIVEQKKPCIMVVTKWDLAEGVTLERFTRYVASRLTGLSFAPLSYLSAHEGLNVDETFALAQDMYRQASRWAPTAEVNRILRDAVASRSPRTRRGGRPPKIYYATQVGIQPPSFLLFANSPGMFSDAYVRYLEGRFREGLGFEEVPVKLILRARREQ